MLAVLIFGIVLSILWNKGMLPHTRYGAFNYNASTLKLNLMFSSWVAVFYFCLIHNKKECISLHYI